MYITRLIHDSFTGGKTKTISKYTCIYFPRPFHVYLDLPTISLLKYISSYIQLTLCPKHQNFSHSLLFIQFHHYLKVKSIVKKQDQFLIN